MYLNIFITAYNQDKLRGLIFYIVFLTKALALHAAIHGVTKSRTRLSN